MVASQSSINENRQSYGHFLPEVCCKAENVLDGVFRVARYTQEIMYISDYINGVTKELIVDTKGPETVDRVSTMIN